MRSEHTVIFTEIYPHRKKISSNQLFSNLFSKNVTFTKFFPKKSESKFPEFPHCDRSELGNSSNGKNFVKSTDFQILLNC